ncbi:hypothetical protein [Puia dinghuensis]|uniref:Glycine cleavage system H protein n=1 Tax=Puia dinghuensis TaxID=1792502 RepID=A0A8J2UBK0_9BACT|nr:hypothetical protein [Puia dinghuensis]GGA94615.1 glycine cleavage system H protein [Puia dinghuensis]
MKNSPAPEDNLYYTHDHEWVRFQGQIAYVGICTFKLTGIRQIHDVEFTSTEAMKKRGEIVAVLHYESYRIPIHMPVDGEILGFNEKLSGENRNIFLQQSEQNKWVALIVPAIPHQNDGLLSPEQYQTKTKPFI